MKVYYKSDKHWNKLTAFYAYQEIIKRIINDFPQLNYLKSDDMIVKKIEMQGANLNDILVDSTLFTNRVIQFWVEGVKKQEK